MLLLVGRRRRGCDTTYHLESVVVGGVTGITVGNKGKEEQSGGELLENHYRKSVGLVEDCRRKEKKTKGPARLLAESFRAGDTRAFKGPCRSVKPLRRGPVYICTAKCSRWVPRFWQGANAATSC